MRLFLFLLEILLLSCIGSIPSKETSPNTLSISLFPSAELQALKDLYYHTNGNNWRWPPSMTRWNFTKDYANPCYEGWAGIICTSNCSNSQPCNVLYLSLQSYGLFGNIPYTIGNFSQLSRLNFANNSLYGALPPTIGNLYNLRILTISNNFFTGYLPATLGNLYSLIAMFAHNNRFYGPVPVSLAGMSYLYILDLSANYLTGQLPNELAHMLFLRVLVLDSNLLSGSLPQNITLLPDLSIISLQYNLLSLPLPTDLGNLRNLRYVNLANNGLGGEIPASLGECNLLQTIILNDNYFTGMFPDSFDGLYELQDLFLFNNHIHGTLPDDIGNWVYLFRFDIHENILSGPLPDTYKQLTNINYLDISDNSFSGSLPSDINKLIFLVDFIVANNFLNSSIPELFYNITNMVYVDFSNNEFTGTIASKIKFLTALNYFYINGNRLHGTIPYEITNITTLQYFGVGDNQMTGTIPKDLGDLKNLLYLILRNNSFYGTLPPSMGNLTALTTLALQYNHFSGNLPWSLWVPTSHAWGLKSVNIFWIQNNFFTGNLNVIEFWRKVVDLNMSSNLFTGQINNNIHRMNLMNSLDVSDNYLTGSLDGGLIRMTGLKVLSVAKNEFTGNFRTIVYKINFTNIDISDNEFTGDLPAGPFFSYQLESFAAVKNCLSGVLPVRAICNNRVLHTLALDGLYTADRCQNRFFPGLPQLTSYQLKVNLPGGLPSLSCLFNMSQLHTLHLSGNAITGSLPSDLAISDSLQDLSLSYNQLTGSIPLVMQQKKNWLNLDLSFNKLNGVLDDSFAEPGYDSSLSLIVNRLSGSIPSNLYHAPSIQLLKGNLFNCNGAVTYRNNLATPSDVPVKDEYADSYQCGSDNINTALYVWILLAGVVVVAVLYIVFFGAYFPTYGALQNTADVIQKTQLVIKEWFAVYRVDYTSKFHQRITSIYVLGKSMEVIRKMTWLITAYALCVLFPAYGILSANYGTHTHTYAWVVSLAYMTGLIPAVVVLSLMMLFFLLFASKFNSFVLESSGLYSYQRKDVNGEAASPSSLLPFRESNESEASVQSHISMKSIQLENISNFMLLWAMCFNSEQSNDKNQNEKKSIDWQSISVGFQITCFNCIPVLIVNMCYVYLTTLNLSSIQLAMIVLAVSFFKIGWNNVMVLSVFADYMNREQVNENEVPHTERPSSRFSFRMSRFSDVAKKVTKESIAKVQFLAHLTIFNNILAPCLADAFVDPDCFYYVVQPPPDVSASYSEVHCLEYTFNNQTVFCGMTGSDIRTTSYNPPFIYSFQCTSALLKSFATVFIYKYIISSIFVPLAKMFYRRLRENQSLPSVALIMKYWVLTPLQNAFQMPPRNSLAANDIQMKSVDRTTTNQGQGQDHEEDDEQRDSRSIAADENPQQPSVYGVLQRKSFRKEAFVVTLLGDLAVLVTFGLAYPPLALVICFAIVVNTFYHQMRIGSYVVAARKEREQSVDFRPHMPGRFDNVLSSSSRVVSAASTSAASRSWQDVVEKLRIECGDLMKLFWPAIPTLSILSAMFMGAFLFDILGDQNGALRAMWVFILMSFVPVIIWLVEYLYLTAKQRWKKYRAQSTNAPFLPPQEPSNQIKRDKESDQQKEDTDEIEYMDNPIHSSEKRATKV